MSDPTNEPQDQRPAGRRASAPVQAVLADNEAIKAELAQMRERLDAAQAPASPELLAENEALRAEMENMRSRLEAVEKLGKPTGIGKTAPPKTLKATGLLSDLVIDKPPAVNAGKTIYRCALKPEYPFPGDIVVAGINFSSRTGRWEGEGDEAVIHERRGSIAALSEDEVQRFKDELQYEYLRFARAKDGTVTGVERVNVTDSGSVYRNPVTGEQTPQPRQRRLGMTQGNEVPLANFLVFEVWGGGRQFDHSVKAAVQRAQLEEEENADIAATAGNVLGSMEAGYGGRSARPAAVLKELSTANLAQGAASGGLLS